MRGAGLFIAQGFKAPKGYKQAKRLSEPELLHTQWHAQLTSSCPFTDFNNSPHRNKELSGNAKGDTDLAITFSNSVGILIEVHLNSWNGKEMAKDNWDVPIGCV